MRRRLRVVPRRCSESLIGKPIDGPWSLRTRLGYSASAQRFVHRPALTLGRGLWPAQRGTVLGRRANGLIGTTVSRRAALPAAVTQDLVDAASAAGEPLFQVLGPSEGYAQTRVRARPYLAAIRTHEGLCH